MDDSDSMVEGRRKQCVFRKKNRVINGKTYNNTNSDVVAELQPYDTSVKLQNLVLRPGVCLLNLSENSDSVCSMICSKK